MLADDELRHALATRLPDLQPDVEGELERLLARADSVVRRRRTAYVAALVAAAVVAAGLVLGHDWERNADEPEPVDDTPGSARPLKADRGFYADPSELAPGRYRARALGSVYPAVQLELDLPSGWGQDVLYAVATGPGTTPPRGGSTRSPTCAASRSVGADAHGPSRPDPAPSTWPPR